MLGGFILWSIEKVAMLGLGSGWTAGTGSPLPGGQRRAAGLVIAVRTLGQKV